MKYLLPFFLASSIFCNASEKIVEKSPVMPGEVWQDEDGKYYLRIHEKDPNGNVHLHLYVMDYLIHSEKCDCEWWKYDY